ncbi:MAG TPA: isoprenoid biosynthesis glyoxalase ElbB [bacterium]|jgi:enhancing lycopene biosynthesis protein 2
MKTVGVVLAGCGFLDGAEVHESVLTLLALDRAGISYQCLAPDIPQYHVVNHVTDGAMNETRNVLVESARIARGNIKPLDGSWVEKLDAVIFPGGFGAAKNYCDWAVKGDECTIDPAIESFLWKVIAAKKPVGLLCISPLVFARAFKGKELSVKLTVGAPSPASASVEKFGAKHVMCPVTEVVVDRENRIVSTPAYMYDARIADVAQGIDKLVSEVISLMSV